MFIREGKMYSTKYVGLPFKEGYMIPPHQGINCYTFFSLPLKRRHRGLFNLFILWSERQPNLKETDSKISFSS